MDRSPMMCHVAWPVERAHNLFAAMGLSHLLVLGEPGSDEHASLVGIITRRDLAMAKAPPRRLLAADVDDHELADDSPAPLELTFRAGAARAPSPRAQIAKLRSVRPQSDAAHSMGDIELHAGEPPRREDDLDRGGADRVASEPTVDVNGHPR